MDPLTIGLLLGGTKMISDSYKEKRDKNLAAETQRYSPWTHNQAGAIQYADPLGTGMQAVGSGLMAKQNDQNTASSQKLLDAQSNYFNNLSNTRQSPYAMRAPSSNDYWMNQLNGS